MICWASSQLGYRNPGLMALLGDCATSVLDAFSPEEIANTLEAFAALRVPHPRLFAAVAASVAKEDALEANTEVVSKVMLAFASVLHQEKGEAAVPEPGGAAAGGGGGGSGAGDVAAGGRESLELFERVSGLLVGQARRATAAQLVRALEAMRLVTSFHDYEHVSPDERKDGWTAA